MKKLLLFAQAVILACISLHTGNAQEKDVNTYGKLEYPETRRVDSVDVYFGKEIADPYRWLEDYETEEVGEWVKEENKVTEGYMSKIPFRGEVKNRLTGLFNYDKYYDPFKAGGYYFYFIKKGLQNHYVLYRQKSLDGEPEVFLDPNSLSEDGTVALRDVYPSNDGKYMAYSITRSGSDWREFYVMDVETGKHLDDHLEQIKFSTPSWYKDGFYYNKYPKPEEGKELSTKNESPKVYYHRLGTPQDEDIMIYEDTESPEMFLGVYASTDERMEFLYTSTRGKKGNTMGYKDLSKGEREYTAISANFDDTYWPIDNIGKDIFLFTNKDAPKGKVIRYDTETGIVSDFIPEQGEVLDDVFLIGGKFVTDYMKDASSRIYIYDAEGNFEKEIEFPVPGKVSKINGTKDDTEMFYAFTSYTYPYTIFRYDVEKGISSVFKESEVEFNPAGYETKQVFYTSKDGTRVPMFITHKKGVELDGNNPAMLYGYGGFNISLLPSFNTGRMVFLENGGIYAVANIRGGGEYGREWHKAGMFENKQNVFDDFIAAAEYLVDEGYTAKDKLAISGGSNGGLLVGAVTNQRPDLFKVAIPAVGVMDMLRYHKFTIGWAWASEYGSSDDPEHFENLLSYSPYHNVKEGVNYPAVLVTTSDHDDRVVPSHSYKYIAALQEKHKGDNPVLIRVETKAGHGYGKPTDKVIDEYTDMWSFVMYNLGMNLKGN